MTKQINTGILTREFDISNSNIDVEARTVSLSFSSENPVDRFWGREILDHDNGSVRLDRMKNAGPVLVDHNPSDHVGVVENIVISADRRGESLVRFGRSDRANEIFNDIQDKIRTNISVGYRIHKMVLESSDDEGVDIFRATDWEPFEISIVSVPADDSVGIGRNISDQEYLTIIEERQMNEVKETPVVEDQQPVKTVERIVEVESKVDLDKVQSDWRREELHRVESIETLGEAHKEDVLAREFVKNGKSLEEFRAALLDKIQARPMPSPDIGMTEKESRQFSFVRAINALANPTDQRAQRAAAFEFEASQAAAEKLGKEARGIMVPNDVMTRDLNVTTATAGGNLVATDLLSQNFIDLLRNATIAFDAATQLTGLVGNVAIPRHTTAASAFWVAESASPTESQQAFDQVTLSPETVGGFTDISRKLLLQSSIDVESFVRRDLARVLAIEIDRVGINGSGTSPEPEGILQTTGIGSVALGTNGDVMTWDAIVSLETEVAIDNADIGSLAYMFNAAGRGSAKRVFIDAGSGERIWDPRAQDTPVNGYRAFTTNQVPSNLTKGTGTDLSAIIFGNWLDLVYGLWGGLDILVDPYTASTSGTVRVVALQDIDVAVRHPESFAAIVDAVTT